MSLLLHETTDRLDDAARGEEFTKGTSHVFIATGIAGILVTVAIALYVYAGQTPPLAVGQILGVTAHAMHVETKGFDANGAPIPTETFDQVYVFTKVKLTNQSKGPLFLTSMMTNATLADGIHSSYAAPASDYDRIFVAYPDMPVARDTPLKLDTTIDAGQTVEGTVVSAFKLTKQEWDARKDLNFTFAFRYQPSLVLKAPMAVIDR
jgi:hypothetical protein